LLEGTLDKINKYFSNIIIGLQACHADLFLLPLKADVVSQPEYAWNISRARHQCRLYAHGQTLRLAPGHAVHEPQSWCQPLYDCSNSSCCWNQRKTLPALMLWTQFGGQLNTSDLDVRKAKSSSLLVGSCKNSIQMPGSFVWPGTFLLTPCPLFFTIGLLQTAWNILYASQTTSNLLVSCNFLLK
jgi:hypothetical protein